MRQANRIEAGVQGSTISALTEPVVEAPAGLSAGANRPIPPKHYRIGEVVDYAGVSRQTIHNYTVMGLLRETGWTAGGHRLYDESVFGRLEQIIRMKRANRSMREIREHFAGLDEGEPSRPGGSADSQDLSL